MTDPKNSQITPEADDSAAVDGMLRGLSHNNGEPDEALISRIMESIEEVDEELHPPLTVIPSRVFWSAAALVMACGLTAYLLLRAPAVGHVDTGKLARIKGERTQTLRVGDKLVAGDVLRAEEDSIIRLADDSMITLAGGTRLIIHDTDSDYRARLDLRRGKLFCRVSKRPGRFRVDAGLPIEVLGTTFGIERTDTHTHTAVYEGSVKVGEGAGTVLDRGKVAQFTPEIPSPMGMAADANNLLAWARPEVGFTNDTLSNVAKWLTVNSRYEMDLPEGLRSKRVAFFYKKGDDLVAAIQAMAASFDLTCRFDGNACVIRSAE